MDKDTDKKLIDVKVTFKGITYRGKNKTKTIILMIPNFKKTEYLSVENQLDNYLNDLDKSDLMEDNDFYCLIDWELKRLSKKETPLEKREWIVNVFKQADSSETLMNDFLSIYQQIYHKIKNISSDKQFDRVIEILGFGIRHTTEVLKDLTEFQRLPMGKMNERIENRNTNRLTN